MDTTDVALARKYESQHRRVMRSACHVSFIDGLFVANENGFICRYDRATLQDIVRTMCRMKNG